MSAGEPVYCKIVPRGEGNYSAMYVLLDLIMELVSMNVNKGFLAYGLEFQKKNLNKNDAFTIKYISPPL